jgi:RimJ/RimL family protein N-acetyltransferase
MDGVIGFVPRVVSLRDGRRVWIRAGGPDDAAAYREYLVRAVPSAEGVVMDPDEIEPVGVYRERLARYLPEKGGLGLFAVPVSEDGSPGDAAAGSSADSSDGPPAGGVIVGDCGLSGFGRRRMGGVLALGMMCDHGWRGVEPARAMLTAALDWARANASSPLGVRRVEPNVMAWNEPALALYRSPGFWVEGRPRARFRRPGGSLADDPAVAPAVG